MTALGVTRGDRVGIYVGTREENDLLLAAALAGE